MRLWNLDRKPRMLLVEDDLDTALLLSDFFEESGAEVDLSAWGQEAVKQCLRVQYDIIILDILLPDIDGYEVFRRIREEGINVPIIFLTKKREVSYRLLGLEMGAVDYIAKPFDMRELQLRVRNALRRPSFFASSYTQQGESPVPAESQPARPGTAPAHPKKSPWMSGVFYLLGLVVIMLAIAIIGANVHWYILPIVILGGLLSIAMIGALQLRQDEELSEENFLMLMIESFKRMPLLKTGRLLEKPLEEGETSNQGATKS